MLPADEHEIVNRARLGPGDMIVVDVERGSVMGTDEIRRRLAFRRRYRRLVADVVRPLADPSVWRSVTHGPTSWRRTGRSAADGERRWSCRAAGGVRLHARGSRAAAPADDRRGPRGDRLDGRRRAPAALSARAAPVHRFLPPEVRAGHQPLGRSVPRIVGDVANDDAGRPRQLHRRARAASAAHRAALADPHPPRARPAGDLVRAAAGDIDIVFPAGGGIETFDVRLQTIADEACAAVERGSALVILTDRRLSADQARCRRCWRRRRCITPGQPRPAHAREHRRRDRRRARRAPNRPAVRLRRRRRLSVARRRHHRVAGRVRSDRLRHRRDALSPRDRARPSHADVEDGRLHVQRLLRRPAVRDSRPRRVAGRAVLSGNAVAGRRRGARGRRRDGAGAAPRAFAAPRRSRSIPASTVSAATASITRPTRSSSAACRRRATRRSARAERPSRWRPAARPTRPSSRTCTAARRRRSAI